MRILVAALALISQQARKKREAKRSRRRRAQFVRGAHKADDANVPGLFEAVHDGLAELLAYYKRRRAGPGCLSLRHDEDLAPTLEAKLARLATSGGGKFVVAAIRLVRDGGPRRLRAHGLARRVREAEQRISTVGDRSRGEEPSGVGGAEPLPPVVVCRAHCLPMLIQ